MITKKQYDYYVDKAKKREDDLMDALRKALERQRRQASEGPVCDLDDLTC